MRRRARNTPTITLTILIASGLLISSQGWAGPPTDSIRKSIDEVIRVLDDPNLKKPEKREERRKHLEDIIGQRFDFEAMAKRTVGKEWAQRTPEERREFVEAFKTLLANSYLGRIEEYSGEKIRYNKEITDGQYAEVKTELDTGKSLIPIDYKLENRDGDWKVYDVVVEGTGLVSNYREQFRRILRKDSFEVLSKMIREKAAAIESPGAAPRKTTPQ